MTNTVVGGLIDISIADVPSLMILHGQRTLIKPNTTPCSTRFIQWATLLPIHGKYSVSLVGPFDFESLTSANRVRQRIHHSHWVLLMEACTLFSISLPTLGTLTPSHRHNNTYSRRKRKQPLKKKSKKIVKE